MKKLIIIQTVSPSYRKNFFQTLSKKLGNKFALFAGDEYFESSVKSDKNINYHSLKNHFIFQRKFLFQTGLWHLLFVNDILVMEMNPRIISNWIFLIIRKLLNKKTVLWGHAWPRKGKNSKTDFIRHEMRKLADKIIVYTLKQQKELQLKMPNKTIKAAPNALYLQNMMQTKIPPNNKHLIFVGRITAKKKVYFLIKAFHKALHILPKDVNLLIAGDGEDYKKIADYVQNNNLKDRIKLLGYISDYNILKKLYDQSIFSVSPGYVGLSVTQSLGFGVPLLVSKNENHSPEIEAVVENENAIFFETDDVDDFVKQIKNIYDKQKEWINKREKISLFCKKNYSVEAMSKAFLELV